ncbi:MAG: alpha/beta hydrolase family protein [Planctomycetota bacterium]
MQTRRRTARFALVAAPVAAAITLATTLVPAGDAYAPQSDRGAYSVGEVTETWTDGARNRSLPVRIYYPMERHEGCPVILFSHGLGGTRNGCRYLGLHWASHGYVSIHVQHPGSDDAVWRGKANPHMEMQKAARDLGNLIHRPKDITFAIDRLPALQQADGPLKGMLDLGRIGVGGHSFGAYTTQVIVGMRLIAPTGFEAKGLADGRVRAALILSPTPTGNSDPETVFGSIRVPCLHMTGTEDRSLVVDTPPEHRRIPFDHIQLSDQALVILNGAGHLAFSDRRVRDGREPAHHNAIRAASLAFWDATLAGRADARRWLYGDGLATHLRGAATVETKTADAQPTAK